MPTTDKMESYGENKDDSDGPLVVVIDGEIAAGKTTLVRLVAAEMGRRGYRAVVVNEPVDEWRGVGILQEFYEDHPPEHRKFAAYDFQTFTFVTRVGETIKTVKANPGADVFILERSVLTARFVFVELLRKLMEPRRMVMYDRWWNMWTQVMPIQPTKFVYLKPSIDSCMHRLEKRAREGEVTDDGKRADRTDTEAVARGGVSTAYQYRLRRAHEAFLQGMHGDEFTEMPERPFDSEKDVLVVDGEMADADFSVGGAARDRIVSFITDKLLLVSTR